MESVGSFVKVAQFSLSELDDSWKDMKQKVTVFYWLGHLLFFF